MLIIKKLQKIVIAFLLIFAGIGTYAQEGFVDIVGEVTCEGDIKGTFARLDKDDLPIDSLYINWQGQYDFRLQLNNEYKIYFIKKGYITQYIKVSTKVPKEKEHMVWTIQSFHELVKIDSTLKKAPDEFMLAEYAYYETSQGGLFLTPQDTVYIKQSEGNANKEDFLIPTEKQQTDDNEKEEIDTALAELLSEGILEDYAEYTDNGVDDEQLKKLEDGIQELNRLKDRSRQDSLLIFEKNIAIQNELLNNARYQLELSRLNARSRKDSLQIRERERRIYLAEQEIENAKNRLKLKNYEIKNQRIILISSISGFVLLLILFIILYSNLKEKKKLTKTLELQNKKLEIQGQGLEKANYLLSMQNLEITASISYAKRIQDAILPPETVLRSHFSDVFLIYKPKDIVSGDFYWLEKVDNKLFFAVVDCTGHGVPGAFMSIIGNRLLNEILYTGNIHDPKELLERLNEGVRHTLQQDITENNDGMDICLCAIEPVANDKFKIIFSGAKRPLFYYIKELEEVKTLKGDRKPIGGRYYQEVRFTNKEIILSKGDFLYLTSDGVMDQNAPDMKKMGTKRFVEILTENAGKSLPDQKQALEYELDLHQQGEDQRDDISVIGVKL